MPEDATAKVPDLSGFSLTQLECTGSEFICAIFWSFSEQKSILDVVYLYLYEASICEASFTCNPFFPETRSVKVRYDNNARLTKLNIVFSEGNLEIAFRDVSFHLARREVREATS